MTRDRKILYMSYIIVTILPFLALLFPQSSSRYVLAVLMVPVAAVLPFLIKKRSILSFNRNEVLGLMALIGILYVSLYFITGIYYGFGRTGRSFFTSFFSYILPIAAIIIAIEIIRAIALAQSNRWITVLSYVMCTTTEVFALSNVIAITSFNRFMDVVGLTLFPAITANLLYHFLSKRYGPWPVVVFRWMITLFPYFIGRLPLLPDSLYSFAKVFFPLLVMLFIGALYDRKWRYAAVKRNRWTYVVSALSAVVMISIVMLVSCQFRFGMLIVGSESMTGEINKGDAIIYERYDDQIIQEGQVVVFKKDNSLLIHRVVDIKNIDGVTRYYTRGDANENNDAGFITDSDILGLTDVKIPYIGYPTIWIRNVFSQN